MGPARNLILSGGPGHEFDRTSTSVAEALSADGVESVIHSEPDAALDALREGWDVLTVNALWCSLPAARHDHLREAHAFHLGADGEAIIDNHLQRGGGLLALHTASICFDTSDTWKQILGATWDWEESFHPEPTDISVRATARGRAHPVTVDTGEFMVFDEAYAALAGAEKVDPLLVAAVEGRDHPVMWAREHGQGRVVVDLLGHDIRSIENSVHRAVIRSAVRWVLKGATDSTGNT